MVEPTKSGCNPSPCGVNAECRDISGSPECICPPNYIGDPYSSCRPECVLNTDCPRDRTCVRNRCENPCTDACGNFGTICVDDFNLLKLNLKTKK